MAKQPPYSSMTKRWCESNGLLVGPVERLVPIMVADKEHPVQERGEPQRGEPQQRIPGQRPMRRLLSFVRKDLFGLFDFVVVGIWPGELTAGIHGVQSTCDDHRADHRTAMLVNENLPKWIDANGSAKLVTWGKHGEAGKRKLWEIHVESIHVQPPVFVVSSSSGVASSDAIDPTSSSRSAANSQAAQ